MAPQLFTIKKRETFVHIRNNGIFARGSNFNIQILSDQNLDNKVKDWLDDNKDHIIYGLTRKLENKKTFLKDLNRIGIEDSDKLKMFEINLQDKNNIFI